MKNRFKYFYRIAGWLVIAAVAILFARTLHANWGNVEDLGLQLDLFVMFALVCFVLAVVVSGLGWGHIVHRLTGIRVLPADAIKIHLASWLLKYVPGQAGSLLNKLAWAKKEGIDGKKITASFIYENVFLLVASTIITVPILFMALSGQFIEGMSLFIPLLISLPFVALILTPKFFAFLLNQLFKILKKKKLERSELLTARDNTRFVLEFTVPRIITGAAFVLIAISLIGIPTSQYIIFGAIYVLAGTVGLLAIFVPSGLGVREAVIVLFASAYIPIEQAVALSIVARFYATMADGLVALLYIILKAKKGAA